VLKEERVEARLAVVIWTCFLDQSVATSGLPCGLVA
jgi:hypothetical protein